jgi:hypothetical protein
MDWVWYPRGEREQQEIGGSFKAAVLEGCLFSAEFIQAVE